MLSSTSEDARRIGTSTDENEEVLVLPPSKKRNIPSGLEARTDCGSIVVNASHAELFSNGLSTSLSSASESSSTVEHGSGREPRKTLRASPPEPGGRGTTPPESTMWRLVVASPHIGAFLVHHLELFSDDRCLSTPRRLSTLDSGHTKLHFPSHVWKSDATWSEEDPRKRFWMSKGRWEVEEGSLEGLISGGTSEEELPANNSRELAPEGDEEPLRKEVESGASPAATAVEGRGSVARPRFVHYIGSRFLYPVTVACFRIWHENLPSVPLRLEYFDFFKGKRTIQESIADELGDEEDVLDEEDVDEVVVLPQSRSPWGAPVPLKTWRDGHWKAAGEFEVAGGEWVLRRLDEEADEDWDKDEL